MECLYIYDTDSNHVIAIINGENKEQCLQYAKYKAWHPQDELSASFSDSGLITSDLTQIVFLPENALY